MKRVVLIVMMACVAVEGYGRWNNEIDVPIYSYDFEARNDDGVTLQYDITDKERDEVEFTGRTGYRYYDFVLRIPESVEYEGRMYKVTGIGERHFPMTVMVRLGGETTV